jgi:hypothetical protein
MTVDSSQIHSVGHDAENNVLQIAFRPNKTKPNTLSVYNYANFTAADWKAMQSFEVDGKVSYGSFLHRVIKKNAEKWPFTRMPDETLPEANPPETPTAA